MDGYIKLYRDLLYNELWKEKRKFSKAEAWIDILLRCNHKCCRLTKGYGNVLIKRGQFLSSNYELAEAWGWSESSVRQFVKYITKKDMILTFPNQKYTIYEVSNYCVYQSVDTPVFEPHTQRTKNALTTHKKRTDNAQKTPNNNDNNDNNDNNILLSFDALFILEHWNKKNIVVHKPNKALEKALNDAIKKYTKDEIIQAIDSYYQIFSDDTFYYTAKWVLEKFLSQKNGVPNFMDGGKIKVQYEHRTSVKTQTAKKSNVRQMGNFKQREYTEEEYAQLYEN